MTTYLYIITRFIPGMFVYNTVKDWQNKQFPGRVEFTRPFGNYRVVITVPADHLAAATGTLVTKLNVLPENKIRLLEETRNNHAQPTTAINII